MILLGLLMMINLCNAGDCFTVDKPTIKQKQDRAVKVGGIFGMLFECFENTKYFDPVWQFEHDPILYHMFYSEILPSFSSPDRPTMSKKRRELERMACLLRFANRDKKLIQQQADACRFATYGEFKSSYIKNKAHHLKRPMKWPTK